MLGLGQTLVALALAQCCTSSACDSMTARLAAAVGRHLSSRCTYIVSGESPTIEVVQFQKRMSKLCVQTSVVTGKEPLALSQGCSTQSLRVVLRADNSTPSLLRHVKGSAWLLVSAGAAPDQLVGSRDVPVDSVVLVAAPSAGGGGLATDLVEVYRAAPHLPLSAAPVAAWAPPGTLRPLDRAVATSLFRRRRLRGLQLLVGAHSAPPVVEVQRYGNITKITSYMGRVWDILQQYLGFSWRYVQTEQDAGRLVRGSWTGCLGALARGEVDVVVGVFLATSQRQMVADFVHDTWQDTYMIYTKAVATGGTRYLAPFSRALWWAVLGFVLFSGGLVAAFHATTRRCRVPWWTSFVHSFVVILCARCMEDAPCSQSARLLELAMQVMGLVLVAAYSSQLISYIAVMEFCAPFSSLEQLVEDGSYRLATRTDCPLNEELKMTQNALLRRMYTSVFVRDRKRRLVSNLDNLRRLCGGPPRSGFIVEMFEAERVVPHLPCRVLPLQQRFARASGYLLFAKRRPYTEFFKITLQSIEGSGILRKLKNDLAYTEDNYEQQEAISVTVEDAWFLYAVLGCGVLISVVFLLLELLAHACATRRNKATALIPYIN